MKFNYHALIYLTHIFFIAPFLFYFWYMYVVKKQKVSNDIWNLLFIIIVVMFLYHGYKYIKYYIL